MVLYKELMPFVVLADDAIKTALEKIERNKHKIVYVVDEKNHLLGSLADGDYRRWSIKQDVIDLTTNVSHIYNANCFSMPDASLHSEIERQLIATNRSIPLVDDTGHLVAIAEQGAKFLTIENKRISAEDPAFLIAEIGNNHQGDIRLAKQLVDAIADSGVDCIKFQMRSMADLYGDYKDQLVAEDLGSQYTLDLLERFQLSDEQLFEAFDYVKQKGLIPLCTPWDQTSLSKLENYGLPAYKVASADFTNYPLLEAIAETGKPMICSTGMSSEDEIRETVAFLENKKAQFVLLHCNSTYPTPFKDVNLRYLSKLADISSWVVGYSGHERGIAVPTAAVALGAKVIEKHVTTDRNLEGNDHKVSLLPQELGEMVQQIRDVETAMGSSAPRSVSQGELMNREILAKSLVAKGDIKAGTTLTEAHIRIISPGKGLQPNRLNDLIGRSVQRHMADGDTFFESDITGDTGRKSRYTFARPYGIPVRYHDYAALIEGTELDFVEFHLSYNDLDLTLNDFLRPSGAMGFAVHAPELFRNDHLLDLASFDDQYRRQSIAELQRVVDHTNELKTYFPHTELPVVVVNAGGWNTDGFLDKKSDIAEKYRLVEQALEQVDSSGVQIAIQTMPPFPWHFGGQSFHNLFVKAEEILAFCERTGTKICLDISHSMMACNYYEQDIYEFVRLLAPHVVHMHIVDALGTDGEGVQIGRGDVDFTKLGKILAQDYPAVPFIPEVWQGHKNNGEGFWQALSYLEQQFTKV